MSKKQSRPSNGPKILVIGGGSVAWTPNLLRDILLTPTIENPTIVLYDIKRTAAELTATFLRKLVDKLGVRAKIVATDHKAQAFKGAQYAIITISTGGLDAMREDLVIPERYRIYQTVGDTAGPGGWARFLRNYKVFVDFADAFNRYAPGCVVLNYTNPMCTLTDVLSQRCKGPVVGLCHGLFENIAFFEKLYKLKDETELSLRYAGVNHFFWITAAHARGKDLLEDVHRKLKRQSLTEMVPDLHNDPMGYGSDREVATELMRATGLMPYLGDRHTCEFVPRLLNDRKTIKQYKLKRTTIAQREKMHRDARKKIQRMIAGKIGSEYTERTRETAADIINAHLNHRAFVDVGNVPNIGQIDNLPRGLVVETPVQIDRHGFQPLTSGPLPDAVLGMVQPHALAYQMQVKAAMQGDVNLALQALRIDPQTAHLSHDEVDAMGRALLKAHRKHLGGLFG